MSSNYLTNDKGGFLLDDAGGRLLDDANGKPIVFGGVHTLFFRSEWGPSRRVLATFDVNADLSGIRVWGECTDDHSPVVLTEIVHVLPGPVHVSLATSKISRCEVFWPRDSMMDGPQANEILFIMNTAAGGRYGASTRISKP